MPWAGVRACWFIRKAGTRLLIDGGAHQNNAARRTKLSLFRKPSPVFLIVVLKHFAAARHAKMQLQQVSAGWRSKGGVSPRGPPDRSRSSPIVSSQMQALSKKALTAGRKSRRSLVGLRALRLRWCLELSLACVQPVQRAGQTTRYKAGQ